MSLDSGKIYAANSGKPPDAQDRARPLADSSSAPAPGAGFYENLAADYDRVIRWEKRLAAETPHWRALWERFGVRDVLDASCGTGRHIELFRQMGLEAWGADGSAEMIALARQRLEESAAPSADSRLRAAFWRDLPGLFSRQFSAVLCVGNSLPYVSDPAELRLSLAGLYSCVAPGGILLIQYKNFEKLLKTRQRFLPVSSTSAPPETVALRMYEYHPDYVDFIVALLEKHEGEWKLREHATRLTPHKPGEVARILAELGAEFPEAGAEIKPPSADWRFFGGLSLDPFDPNRSEDVVILASRPRTSAAPNSSGGAAGA